MQMSPFIDIYLKYLQSLERSKKTIEGYKYDLFFFSNWLESRYNGPCYIEDIVVSDVEAFLTMLKTERHYKPASRRRLVATLNMLYRFAVKKGYCDRNIVDQLEPIKVTAKERDYFNEEEVLFFVKNVKHKLCQIAIYIMFYAGLRISECVHLKVDHVDLERRRLRVVAGKGNKDRTIPICDKLYLILLDYEKWRFESDYYLATSKSGQFSKVRLSAIIKETRERLNLEKHVTAHTFRHSFASRLVSKDVNIVSISKLLGHSDVKVTSIYTHTDIDRLEADINRL